MSRAALAEQLTNRINPYIDVPWMTEAMEYRFLYPVVEKAVPFIPSAVWPYLTESLDGITDAERAEWEPKVVAATSEALLAPFPEFLQRLMLEPMMMIVRSVITAVFDYAQGQLPGGDQTSEPASDSEGLGNLDDTASS